MLKYEITDILRNQLLNIRRDLNLTSAQMGAIIGKSSSAYNCMENGTSNTIPHKLLMKIYKAAKLAEDGNLYNNVEIDKVDVSGLSEFIIKKLDVVINTYSSEILQDEIWLHSLYLEHHIVSLDPRVFRDIVNMYGTDNWTKIFSSLNKNPSIMRKFIYKEKNLPYVEKRIDEEKNANQCPYWACLYELSDEDIDKMADQAITGKINAAVLFTLFLNHSVKNELSVVNHYTKVATYFLANSIPLVFNRLDMIEKPKLDKVLSPYFLELIKFLNTLEVPESDKVMSNLRNNLLDSHLMFASAVSFNFSFPQHLSDEKLFELHGMLEDVITEFRRTENI